MARWRTSADCGERARAPRHERSKHIVVIGQGAAGLSAALAAAGAARAQATSPRTVTLIDKAPEADAGGNTRWTPSYMRMASVDRVEPSFVHDMLEATEFQGDEDYFATLAAHAPATVQWIAAHGVPFHQPVYYLAKGPPRIQPVGGGETIHRELTRAARDAGVVFRFDCAADALIAERRRRDRRRAARLRRDAARRRRGPRLRRLPGQRRDDARAFRRRRRRRAAARAARAFQRRRRHPHGAGARRGSVRRAGRHAHRAGRSALASNQAPVVLLYPYGIVVDRDGRRFFDEGAGLVHETWEAFSRRLHFEVPGRTAYAILDARVRAIPDWQRATRSEVPPFEAATLGELGQADRRRCGRSRRARSPTTTPPAPATRKNSTPRSATASPRRRRSRRRNRTGRAPSSSRRSSPGRSIGAIAYTFGGLATDARARVLRGGAPIPGLYAAGEITGHFYGTAPNAVSVLRAFVFGRIAGREAAGALAS